MKNGSSTRLCFLNFIKSAFLLQFQVDRNAVTPQGGPDDGGSLLDLQSMASMAPMSHHRPPAPGSSNSEAPQSASFIDSAVDLSMCAISENNQLVTR